MYNEYKIRVPEHAGISGEQEELKVADLRGDWFRASVVYEMLYRDENGMGQAVKGFR